MNALTLNQSRHLELKEAALRAYGECCRCCGETWPVFLTLDHLKNNGAAHRKKIHRRGGSLYQWLKTHGYPEGFQVLCYNCNAAKHWKGECPHTATGRGISPYNNESTPRNKYGEVSSSS